MKQQAAVFAIEALEKYDGVRSLESFLWVHIRNRLYNFKRDNYFRPNKPCLKCPLNAYVDNECVAYDDEMQCEWYIKWYNRADKRKKLMSTKEGEETSRTSKDIIDALVSKDLFKIVDEKIPLKMREDWLRFAHGARLPKTRTELLLEEIRRIINDGVTEA